MYAVVTTFANEHFNIYAKAMIESFVKYWPQEIPLLIQLDDEALKATVEAMIRPQDAVAIGWSKQHIDFVTQNKANDDLNDYRKQTTRFCHKVFALHRALEAINKEREAKGNAQKYLIWMDADVITTKLVTLSEVRNCLPRNGEAVSYLGRKDWPHSECGWLAFDLENRGDEWIDVWYALYISGEILKLKETHDSWAFDHIKNSKEAPLSTNLTEGKPGMDIWPHSPMGQWSTHKKGPIAKQQMGHKVGGSGLRIQTKNSVSDSEIQSHIMENQKLIKNWVRPCKKTNEQIIVVSAGPQLSPEDILEEYHRGKKIVAVKHALKPLKEAGINPWACILLDPRPHVYDFVDNPDPDILWFVASQVNPKVIMKLLAHGCTVWGYHASVGAGEQELTARQPYSIIGGGSATATRGLYLLAHLGFSRMKLYGYDLCYPDKVDLNARDQTGQPKFLEMSIEWNNPLSNLKKCFWTDPQLIAQLEELNIIIQNNIFDLEAVGEGIIPFVLKSKVRGELRQAKLRVNIKKTSHEKMLKWNKNKKIRYLMMLRNLWRKSLPAMKRDSR